AFPPPDRFARLLVQRDHELMIAPVEIDDEQVPVKNRRRTRAAEMVADEVTPFPKNFARLCLEAGCARRTEAHVNPPLLDHRRRRRVAVERVAELRLLDLKDFLVPQNVSAVTIYATDA